MWWAWLQVSPDWKCSSSTCRPCTWVCPGHGYSEEDWRWSSDGVATQVCILSWSARSFESERSSEWQHLIFFTWPHSLVWLKTSSPQWCSRWKAARTGQHSCSWISIGHILIYLRESDGRKSGFPNLIVSPVCCSHSLIHLILCCKLHHSLYQLIRIQVPLQSLLQENVHTV